MSWVNVKTVQNNDFSRIEFTYRVISSGLAGNVSILQNRASMSARLTSYPPVEIPRGLSSERQIGRQLEV
jgi:hypothetical protein